MTREARERSMRWIPLALLIFFFIIASFVMGLSTDDDSHYLDSTRYLHLGSFLHLQDWSPLYILWFTILRNVCPNPIACFFLSWGLLVSLLVLIPVWYRMRSAWVYALILLGFPFCTIDPFVCLFAAAILLTGMCVILNRTLSFSATTGIFCLFAFVTAFARPEFNYAVYLSAVITVIALVLERTVLSHKDAAPKTLARSIVLGFTVVALAAGLFGITRHSQWSRSGIAFAQHYNRRAAEHGIIPAVDSWRSDYSQRRFGIDLRANSNTTTATVFDFLRANPRHFVGHMLENLRDPRARVLILVLAFFVLWPWFRRDVHHLRTASVFVLLIGIPCIVGSIVIYPRSHYAMVLIPSLTIYALQLFDAARWLPSRPSTVALLGCALIWLTRIGLPLRDDYPDNVDRQYLQRVQCARQVDRSAPALSPVFESVPMLDIYFTHRRTIEDTGAFAHWAEFQAAVAQQHPAWISVDEGLAPRLGLTSKQLDDTLRGDLGYDAHPCSFGAQLTIYEKTATVR